MPPCRTVVAALSIVMLVLYCGTGLAAENETAFDAHATSFSYFFKDVDMDFHFGNLALGAAVNQGLAIGEAFYAASQIKDGDAASWAKRMVRVGRARRVPWRKVFGGRAQGQRPETASAGRILLSSVHPGHASR